MITQRLAYYRHWRARFAKMSTPMGGSSSNVFTRDGDSDGTQGCRLGEICHPVHGTIHVVHAPRLYHHCHPSSKIKLISHMSARSVPFTYAFDSVA